MSSANLQEIIREKKSPLNFIKGILKSLKSALQTSVSAESINEIRFLPLSECRNNTQKDHFFIIGSLHKVYPRQSVNNVKVLILNGASKVDNNCKVRVILFNDCAVKAELAKLQQGDYLGFYKPAIIPNCSIDHTEEEELLSHQVLFGRKKKEKSFFFYMRMNPKPSHEASVISGPSNEPPKEPKNENGKRRLPQRFSDLSFVSPPDSKRNRNTHNSESNSEGSGNLNNSDGGKEGTTRNLRSNLSGKPAQTKEKENEPACSQSVSADNAKEVRNGDSKVNKRNCRNIDIKILKSRNSNIQVPISGKDYYEYKELKDIQDFKEIHCFAVIREVLGEPTNCQKEGRMLQFVKVTDSSIYHSELTVCIYYNTGKPPTLQKDQVIRFHRLKVELDKGKPYPKVFQSWDVLTFDPIETDRALGKIKGFSTAHTCSFRDEDREKAWEVTDWMKSTILAQSESNPSEDEDMVLEMDNPSPEINFPKTPEEIGRYFENIDQSLITVQELSELSYDTKCNFVCQVFEFHKFDNDRAALIVGDGKNCPLKLTAFTLAIDKHKTLEDCLKDKDSIVKPNSLHISILLENVSAKPIFDLLQASKELFITHCKIPPEKPGGKADLIIKCDLREGDIIILDFHSKREFKKLIRKLQTTSNELKTKGHESSPQNEASSSTASPKNSAKKDKNNTNLEELSNAEGCSENAGKSSDPTNEPYNGEDVNNVNSDVNSNLTGSKSPEKYNIEKLASSQLSILTKCTKEGKVIPTSAVPNVTHLQKNDLANTFGLISQKLKIKKEVEKQTSLMMSNGITNGPPPSHSDYSFDRSCSSLQDLEYISMGSSPAKICRTLDRSLSEASEASKSSDETNIERSSDLVRFSPKRKVPNLILPRVPTRNFLETSKVNEDATTNAAKPSKPLSTLNSQSILSSPPRSSEKSVSSPSKINTAYSPKKVQVPEKKDIPKSSAQESSTVDQNLPQELKQRLRNSSTKTTILKKDTSSTHSSTKTTISKKDTNSTRVVTRNNNKSPTQNNSNSNNLDDTQYSSAKNCSPASKHDEEDSDQSTPTVILPNSMQRPVTSTPTNTVKKSSDRVTEWLNNSFSPDDCLGNDLGVEQASNEYLILKIMPVAEDGNFSIVSGFCVSGCQKYTVIKSFPPTPNGYFCASCQAKGTNAKLNLRFLMKFYLMQYKTLEHVEALLTSPVAEQFLDCTVENFVKDKNTRKRTLDCLKKLLVSTPVVEDGVRKSLKLNLLLKPRVLNGKTQLQITEFETPKVFEL